MNINVYCQNGHFYADKTLISSNGGITSFLGTFPLQRHGMSFYVNGGTGASSGIFTEKRNMQRTFKKK